MGRTPLFPSSSRTALDAAAWLEEQRRFWEEVLDRLAEHLGTLAEERHDDRDRDQDGGAARP